MGTLHGKRNVAIIFIITFIILTFLYCSKKSNPVAHNEEDELTTPTLTFITPSNDTTVGNATDSITLTAVIANSDDIDSLLINGSKVSLEKLNGDTVKISLKLGTDTSSIMVAIYYQETKSLKDSIVVFRETSSLDGMAKISGTLLQESSSPLAKKLAKKKIAFNAQGTKIEVDKVIPVSGADIMIYDAEALSTSADTTVKTDSAGAWSVELEPGNYFMFAVYFDREKLEIVTTTLPDIKAEKDKETTTDSSIAVSDDINPMVTTFLDAAEANNDNAFIASAIPAGLPIVMSFSEPMTRASAGDSLHGIVLGKVNTDSSELPLVDTLPVKKLWGPDGKELRLIPTETLIAGTTYKVIIPSATKDLALNKLDNDYSGIFEVTESVTLPAFALKSTIPEDDDTIQAGFPVECIFTRPVDGLSLNKRFTLSSSEDVATAGFFEVKGNVARFVNKSTWQAGKKYTLTILKGVKDLLGDSLDSETKLSFYIMPKDSFEVRAGVEGEVASAVKLFTSAYIAGDIDKFSQSFHPSFELVESQPDGQVERKQLLTFIEMIRAEIAQRNRLSKYGIIDPVYYYPVVNGHRYITWKLSKGSTSVYFEDLGTEGGIGTVPRVFSLDKDDITDSVRFINRAIVYNGETLYFAPDMSKAFIGENARSDDPTIFGKLLRSETNVETRDIMLNFKSDFVIRTLTVLDGNDTALAMLELVSEEQYLNGQHPGPVADPDNPPPAVTKNITALQTKMVLSAGKWMVLQIAANEIYSGDKEEFSSESIADTAFVIKNFEQTRPITLVTPQHKAREVEAPIEFSWSVANADGIGGYLVAISNELSGGTQGLLVFTRAKKLTITEKGAVDSNATILSVDPKTLSVPLPPFASRLTSFSVGDSDVYVWKVIGISDTLPSAIKSGMQVRVIADSDFGTTNGVAIFTMMDNMPDFTSKMSNVNQAVSSVDNTFTDRDGDGYPDWIEKAFATSPDDPGDFPNFSLDTDLDGYPDFLEQRAGSDSDDPVSKPGDTDPADNIPDTLQKRAEWRPSLALDDDNDGFPNEIEMLFGTDPWNAQSKPSKSIKASVPVNTYFGGIKLGDAGWKRLNFSLRSDTSGDFAFIKNTGLEGIAKNGTDLTVKLFWNNGEWVFYLGFVNGMNTGKFLKVRFHSEGTDLRGLVDMADQENGGGPYVGEFFASVDSIENFNNIGSATAGTIINQQGQGTINLGSPPMDLLKRPESGSEDIRMELSFSETAGPSATVSVNDESVVFEQIFWSPGQFPAIGGNAPASSKQYRFEGSLYRRGTTGTDDDTLIMIGIIEFNKDNGSGGTFRQKYDFVLFTTGITELQKPSGAWVGWYTLPITNSVNEGPKPFIGLEDSVVKALERTDNKGLLMETGTVVTISSTERNESIWMAAVGDNSYYIMEVLGDYTSVMIKDIDNQPYIVLSSNGPGGETGGNQGMPFFTGDSSAIVTALSNSSNMVQTAATSQTFTINPETLHRETREGTTTFLWVAVESANLQRHVAFLAGDENQNSLKIDGGKPIIMVIGAGEPSPISFTGD